MKFPRNLIVTITTQVNVFIVNQTNGIRIIGGLEAEFLRTLSQALRVQFQPVARLEDFNTESEDTFFVNNSNITLGRIAMFEEFARVGYPTFPYDFGDIRFVVRPPVQASKSQVFLQPFSIKVWMSILVTLFFMPIIIRTLSKNQINMQDLYIGVVATLVQKQPITKISPTFGDRSLNIFWQIGALIIAFSYTSTVLSFLMVPGMESSVDTLTKLLEAIDRGSYKCAIIMNSGAGQILQHSGQTTVRLLGQKIEANRWEIEYSPENVLNMIKENWAVVLPDFLIYSLPPDQLVVSKNDIYTSGVVIYTRNDFCCKDQITRFSLRLAASGLYSKMVGEYYFKQQLVNRKKYLKNLESKEEIKVLTLDDVMGAFIVYGIGCSLSVLVLTVEMLRFRAERTT